MTMKTKLLAGVAFALTSLPGIAAAEDKVISYLSCGDKMQPAHEEFIKTWEAANAGYKIQAEVVGWDQCQDKATTLAAAGTPVRRRLCRLAHSQAVRAERPDRADHLQRG